MKTSAERLAKKLKAIKDAKKLNTKDFIEAAGIPETVMHRLLKASVDPRLSTVDTAAKRLGVSASELIK